MDHLDEMTALLTAAVKNKTGYLLKKSHDGKSWRGHFENLCKEYDPQHVINVLAWYGKHINDEYMPEAYNGKQFREKFDRLQAKYARELSKQKGGKKNHPQKQPAIQQPQWLLDGFAVQMLPDGFIRYKEYFLHWTQHEINFVQILPEENTIIEYGRHTLQPLVKNDFDLKDPNTRKDILSSYLACGWVLIGNDSFPKKGVDYI